MSSYSTSSSLPSSCPHPPDSVPASYLLRTLLEFLIALLLSAWMAVEGILIEVIMANMVIIIEVIMAVTVIIIEVIRVIIIEVIISAL